MGVDSPVDEDVVRNPDQGIIVALDCKLVVVVDKILYRVNKNLFSTIVLVCVFTSKTSSNKSIVLVGFMQRVKAVDKLVQGMRLGGVIVIVRGHCTVSVDLLASQCREDYIFELLVLVKHNGFTLDSRKLGI